MTSDAFSRQSFLGPQSQEIIEHTRIGIIGLSGGGSHIVQLLAHIGFLEYALYDPDPIEQSNLHRLVGATQDDVDSARLKVDIALRGIIGVRPKARIQYFNHRWQQNSAALKSCDIIFGCTGGAQERHELEVLCRRHLIPYIDIGMDVRIISPDPPRMAGQVFLSMPGYPCMWCCGLLTERSMAEEAVKYGDAGGNPQVVWTNAILASAAIGIAIDLLTDWTRWRRSIAYLSYDGNTGLLQQHPMLPYIPQTGCSHYPLEHVGQPKISAL
jgi:molybdopterin-synthase adenylyltransferase